jgi:hypothetical protein
MSVLIPGGTAQVSQLRDMNPLSSSLVKVVVVHLMSGHLLLIVLEDLLSTIVQMHCLETLFLSSS